MKKFLLLAVAAMMPVFMMAHVNGNGSTRANAIDFSWDNGHVQTGSKTLWYKVSLDSLKKQENPALALYLTSLSTVDAVQVSVEAYVGETSTTPQATKECELLPGKQLSWNVNAAIFVRMKIDTVYIKLKTKTTLEETAIKLSARAYDASVDLDETCKDAKPFNWSGITQAAGATQWYKVDLTAAKAAANKDVKIAITNNGSGELHLIASQSMDCPSTGQARRSCALSSHQTVYDTIPQDVIKSMLVDELYIQFDNDQPIKVSAELIDAPASPIYSGTPEDLHVDANLTVAAGEHFYRISVNEMNSMAKFEPEFTFRNNGEEDADIIRKMSFSNPVMGWQSSEVVLPAGGEFSEVIKKNILQAINTEVAPYIYIFIKNDKPFQLVGRFKNVREGKACKSNIDFDWEKGHIQEGKTTQWYAIDVTEAKKTVSDINVEVANLGYADATVKAEVAFSCPYLDLQTATRTVKLSKPSKTTINYSSYALLTDTIWVGVTTDQDIRFSAEAVPAKTKPADPNDPCLQAKAFDWENGMVVEAGIPQWIKVDMRAIRDSLNKFPTLHIINLSAKEVTINGELSLECPDTIENQTRTLKIAGNETFSKKISRNMFENIKADSVYIRVEATQDIFIQLRLTDDSEGTTCGSAVEFRWKIGNDQKANENIWYAINLIDAIESKSDVKVTIVNKDDKECKGVASVAYDCMDEILQEVNFTLGAKQTKSKVIPFSSLELLTMPQIFVNLAGNTALHIQAELVPAEKLATPITCEDLADAKKLDWNTEYTHNGGTAWYKLDRNILDSLLNGKLTAEARVWNESGAEQEITAEVAFACPIEYKMASRTITLKNGRELVKAIEANTAQQLSTKEVVFVRLTSTGAIKFQARLIAARDGRDRMHAVDFEYNKAYAQEANTTVWYRVNTSVLKDIDDVDGARLFAEANMPEANTTIEVAVFEDNSDVDLIEYYTNRKAKRTFKKARSGKHHIPAYIVKALADDKVVYARVTTDKPLSGRTELSRYNKLADGQGIPTKKLAKLAVPNVEYTIPAGGQWFAICVKDLKENFELTTAASFSITNPNADSITISGTATWQDSLTYDIPYRTRGINKGVRSYTMTFLEAAEKAAKRKGYDIPFDAINPIIVDSFARAYSTDEHLTAYVFIKHDGKEPIQARINLQPKKGDKMTNAIAYDWEHGNVNPGEASEKLPLDLGRAKNWFMVELKEDNMPKDKDLELQITNWSETETSATKATIMIDELSDLDGKTIEVELAPGEKKSKRIDRTLLLGMSNVFIEFESSQVNYIWTEFVDTLKRDTIPTHVDEPWCVGVLYEFESDVVKFEGTLSSVTDTLRFEEKWEVVRDDEKGVHKCDSIVYHRVFALKDPTLVKIENIPADKKVYTSAATDWLKEELNKASAVDSSYKEITGIVWEIATNDANTKFKVVPEAELKNEAIVLRYGAIAEC